MNEIIDDDAEINGDKKIKDNSEEIKELVERQVVVIKLLAGALILCLIVGGFMPGQGFPESMTQLVQAINDATKH